MLIRFVILSVLVSTAFAESATISIKGVTTISETDDTFICATLDWWPPGKCNYGQCPWGNTGIPYLNLKNPIIPKAIKAFSPLRLRLGGSLQDQILYKVGKQAKKCANLKNNTNGGLFGFSKGCLTMERWDEFNALFSNTGAKVTFGLNALIGRKREAPGSTLFVGDWKPENAVDFINYTISKGYKIDSYEFGNELCGNGIAAKVYSEQYAKDVIVLKNILDKLYKSSSSKPKLVAPGGFYDFEWYKTFLQKSGPNVVDVITHHIYNLGAGVDPSVFFKIQDPYFLNQVAQTYKDLETTIKDFGPWSSVWVGESGGAFNSGGKNVSNTFVNSFWYLDQLGMTSTFNHKVFCRQTLVGGNYGLLDTETMVPNPDYYSALLWHRLMGAKVLATNLNASPYLRAYTHCSRKKPGITVLLINLSNSTSFDVSVTNDLNLYASSKLADNKQANGQKREEYHLTPKDGDLRSRVMLLNGSPLQLTEFFDIPPLNPNYVDSSLPIKVAPHSIVFANIKDFNAPACA